MSIQRGPTKNLLLLNCKAWQSKCLTFLGVTLGSFEGKGTCMVFQKCISVQHFYDNQVDPFRFYMSGIDCCKKHRLCLTRRTMCRACGVSDSCNMWPRILLSEQTYQSATSTSTKSSVTLDIILHLLSVQYFQKKLSTSLYSFKYNTQLLPLVV